MAQKSHDDGGFVRSYAIGAWVVLRIYGAAFCYLTWLGYQWMELDHPMLAELLFGLPDLPGLAILAFVGGVLAVPFLTPRFIAKPRSIAAGVGKAVVVAGLSVWLYFMLETVLISGVIGHGKEFAELLPLLLKCLAGMSITGAILVGFVGEMTGAGDAKAPGQRKRQKKDRNAPEAAKPRRAKDAAIGIWRPEASTFGTQKLDANALHDLRNSRMPQA